MTTGSKKLKKLTLTTCFKKRKKQLLIHKADFFFKLVCFKERFLVNGLGFLRDNGTETIGLNSLVKCLSEPKIKKRKKKKGRNKKTQILKHWLISLALLKKLYRCDFTPGLHVYI